jgi:hypothetical protein
MERVKALINRLHEQSLQDADAASLMATVELLQSELAYIAHTNKRPLGSAKVAVVLPSNNRVNQINDEEPLLSADKAQLEETYTEKPAKTAEPVKSKNDIGWLSNPLKEIPTLAHQEGVKELNDIIGQNGTSLNERLKTSSTELGEALIESPIKDLRKGIGINDRYVFVSELFRGDEAMYERSIKTINNFHILPEAQYWMERELKIKLAWDDSKEITQHFYHLVKRRFS